MNLLLALLVVPALAAAPELSRVEFGVRDLPAATAWFEKDLDWTPESVSAAKAVFVSGGARVALTAGDADSAATVVLVSADADADFARLVKRGAAPLAAPEDWPSGFREAVVRGPGALRVRFDGPLANPPDFEFTEAVAGKGAAPGPDDTVKVRYTGRLKDGTVFDGPQRRPRLIPLGSAIACWRKALPMMRVGGKARFTCPAALAYGAKGRPPLVPPNAALDFEVELVDLSR